MENKGTKKGPTRITGEVTVTFVPHLAPMTRGILGTHYATPQTRTYPPTSHRTLPRLLRRRALRPSGLIGHHPLKRHGAAITSSSTSMWTPKTGRLIIITALDNLVKGAAGAAIQNMNLMLGLPEETGLQTLAILSRKFPKRTTRTRSSEIRGLRVLPPPYQQVMSSASSQRVVDDLNQLPI